MKTLSLLLISLITLSSCSFVEKENVVVIDNKYSMELPDFLSHSTDLHDEASLQYDNRFREFYVLVLDEKIDEMNKVIQQYGLEEVYTKDLDGYANLLLANLEQAVTNMQTSELIDTVINNLPAKYVTITGEVDDVRIFYTIAYLQGKKDYYQVTTWTLDEKEEQYKNRMKKMIATFKEL